MAFGDHIYVARNGVYSHHGVDIGDGHVIHRSSPDGTKRNSAIRETELADFLNGGELHVRYYGTRLDPAITVARARSTVGRGGYDLVFDNCEHFATWCAADEYASTQVDNVVSGTGVAAACIGTPSTTLTVVIALGSGAPLSGPNLVSGLSVIGGNVIGGTILAGGVTGAATTYGMSRILKDSVLLTDDERTSRRAGRWAAAAGAAAGTVGSVYAVGALGLTGYSAAGLTSGFAAIGAAVAGGGMSTGITAAIALPALLAVALALLVYLATRRGPRPGLLATALRP